jgi:hypothetical protein
MGRYISEKGNVIWKYAFSRQDSEQYRIADELDIGSIVKSSEFGDTLRIERRELEILKRALRPHAKMIIYYKKFLSNLSPAGWLNTEAEKVLDTWLIANGFQDIYFWGMVRAFIRYIEKQKRRWVFYFEGEY